MMEMLSMLNASQLKSKDIISAHLAKRNVNYHHIPVNDKSSKLSPKISKFPPASKKFIDHASFFSYFSTSWDKKNVSWNSTMMIVWEIQFTSG